MIKSSLSLPFVLLLCIGLIHPTVVHAQMNLGDVVIYNEESGMSHVSVSVIHKSTDGYLWVGTMEGLNRFNGRTFEYYRDKGPQHKSLSNKSVLSVTEDKNGFLWIGTQDGLNKYDPRTERFTAYRFFEDDREKGGYAVITALLAEGDVLWVGTASGVVRFNINTENYTKVDLGPKYHATDLFKDVFDFANQENLLWVGTKKGLFCYDKDKQRTKEYLAKGQEDNTIEGTRINHIRTDDSSRIWLSTDKGITELIPGGAHFWAKNYNFYDPQDGSILRDFYYTDQINDSTIILGTIVSGLFTFNTKTQEPASMQMDFPYRLKTKAHYFDRKNNILWIGALNKGLIKINPSSKLFRPHVIFDRSDRISSFYIFIQDSDRPEIIWAGSTTGLIRYNRHTGQHTGYYVHFENDVGYTIRSLIDDAKGNIYVGTHGKGLFVFNKRSGTFKKHLFSEKYPEYGEVHAVCLHQNKLYIGASNVLFVYDTVTDKFEKHLVNEVPDASIEALYLLGSDKLMVGSLGNRLAAYNISSHNIEKIPAAYKDGDTDTCALSGISFTEFDENLLLFGTFGNGICVYDKKRNLTYQDTRFINSNYDVIYGIITDKNGNLWASSNYGLLFYERTEDSWITFRKSDGLQGNEFNIGAAFMASDGELFFGGNNGFNHFYPDDIEVQRRPIRLYFESFKVFNALVEAGDSVNGNIILHESIRFQDTLRLNYRQNFLNFSFSAIDYLNPLELRYRYKLEGFSDEWVYTERKNNTAVFTNLSPGEYVLIVQARSKYSDFEDNQIKRYIFIKPPFYKRPIFYFLVVLSVVLIIFLLIKLRERSLKIEKRKLEQLVDLRTLEIRRARNDFEQEKEFVDAIIEISPEGIAVFDKYGSFMRLNPALLHILGYTSSELAGTNLREITPPEWHEQINNDLEDIGRGASIVSETELIRKDGKPIDIRMSSAGIADSAFVSVITDISERKIAEYKAEQYRAELEKQVKERTEDYKKAKEKAENADRLKTAFLANMSHEIRTPLNSILGFAQLLNEDGIGKEQIKTYTDLIQRGGNSLLHLINDIIDLAKIESNQLSIEKEYFSINELMDETFRLFSNSKENIQNGKIEMRINIPAQDVSLYSDPNRIKQVIINLLNNAHKFTDKGHIEVGYTHVIETGMVFLRFYVEDSGAGIPPDNIEKIFSRFTKFDKNSTRVIKGAGLGLAISKRIVDLLGGSIGVESEFGVGSTFYFTIPLQ